MEKILTQNIQMEKINLNQKKYRIRVSPKDNGYQARTTLDLGGVLKKNPRPECFSTESPKEALNRLIEKIQIILSNYTSKRLKLVSIEEPDTVYYVLEETLEKPQIIYKEPIISDKLIVSDKNNKNSLIYDDSKKYYASLEKTYSVTEVGYVWFNSLLDRASKQPDEENYLSRKTIESYINILKKTILPFYKDIYDITTLEEDNIIELLNTIKAKTQKKDVLTVIKIFFSFAKQNKYIKYNIAAEVKLPRKRKALDEIDFIEESDRENWISTLISENTDISLIFLTILLTSARPEEGCGLKWNSIDFDNDDIYICNAYKDFKVYNENMEVIGHERRDDILKTPESYRHIHLDPILKKILIKHKENQQKTFKKFHKKWTEEEYVFLNQYHKPFIPSALSKAMPKFLSAHKNLSYLTVYGLRHSFATHCKELGMEPEVLAKIMGHTDYSTTQKYYVHISKQRKISELKRIQEKERNGFKKLNMSDITELENYNQQTFEDFTNFGIEIDADSKLKSTYLSA